MAIVDDYRGDETPDPAIASATALASALDLDYLTALAIVLARQARAR